MSLRLKDKDHTVRAVAFGSIAAIVQQGNSQIVKQILMGLTDDSPVVRKAALEALADAARRGDSRVVVKIVPSLLDNDVLVREAAAVALGKLADSTDTKTVRTLADLLSGSGKFNKETNVDVRSAFEHCIEQIKSNEPTATRRQKSWLCGMCRSVDSVR